MNFGVLVDVCLGVLSVMILFSLAAAAINEMIADNILNMRGKSLYEAIVGMARKYVPGSADYAGLIRATEIRQRLLGKLERFKGEPRAAPSAQALAAARVDEVVEEFYKDPAIQALMESRSWGKWLSLFAGRASSVKGGFRPPSAIEPTTFGAAFSKALGDDSTRTADQYAEEFRLVMDRTSGWYVRKVKTSLFLIGLFLAVGANVDLLKYADDMSRDANLHERIDATVGMINALEPQLAAPPAGNTPAATDTAAVMKDLKDRIEKLDGDLSNAGLTVGWTCVAPAEPKAGEPAVPEPGMLADWLCAGEPYLPLPGGSQIIGWLIIALGVTLGAQFWFDLFRTLVNLRTPGKTGGSVEAPSRT